MTPDHLHATIAMAAMKKGQHVMMHKPLANRLHEGRLVVETARQTKVATHLLAYGLGAGNGLIARADQGRRHWPAPGNPQLDESARVAAIHGDSQGHAAPSEGVSTGTSGWGRRWTVPIIRITPTRFFAVGTTSAAVGWPTWAFTACGRSSRPWTWALLSVPRPGRRHTCTIVDHVCRTPRNDFSYPTACTIRFQFAAQAKVPALDLFWYDGGMKPRLPGKPFETQNVEMAIEGILFVGDQGAILAGFNGEKPQTVCQRPA